MPDDTDQVGIPHPPARYALFHGGPRDGDGVLAGAGIELPTSFTPRRTTGGTYVLRGRTDGTAWYAWCPRRGDE